MAIDSFVLGILSLYLSGIPGIICGAIGLNSSKKALAEKPEQGFARAGRICCIVGIINAVLTTAFLAVFFIMYFGLIAFAITAAGIGL